MKLLMFVLMVALVYPSFSRADVFSAVEYIKLDNGLQVFLAPSATASQTKIKIEVDTGTKAEDESNWGVAHLLEHVLFRDKELKDEMSYLQIIKENGGSANGSTNFRYTNYFATIPPAKADWLLNMMTKMILDPVITDNYVTKEKSTVELERGRPSPVVQVLRHDFSEIFQLNYLKMPEFSVSEFSTDDWVEPYSIAQEQLSTQRLTTTQVQQFYDEYYHPENMNVYVVGKFDRAAVMKVINEKWAKLPAGKAKRLPELELPQPRLQPYKRTARVESNPNVYIGSKVWDLKIGEEDLISSYLDYLSHRLMKEIRNKKGQTYSANTYNGIGNKYGYVSVGFQTTNENYDENLKVIRDYIEKEAQKDELSNEQITEAKKLWLDKFELRGRETDDMMYLADDYSDIMRDYGKFESPVEYVRNITPEQYRVTLAL